MLTLFDQELVTELYHEELAAKATAKGMEKGLAEGLAKSTSNLMKAQNLTATEAMDILAIPDEDRPKIVALL